MGCVTDWVNAGTVIDGRVRMGFKLDSDGLQDVWIARRDEVPLGVTSCLSGAIWQANWPGTTNGEVIIQYPFQLSSADDEDEPTAAEDGDSGVTAVCGAALSSVVPAAPRASPPACWMSTTSSR